MGRFVTLKQGVDAEEAVGSIKKLLGMERGEHWGWACGEDLVGLTLVGHEEQCNTVRRPRAR